MYDPAMRLPCTARRVFAGLVLVLVAGCGADAPQHGEPLPKDSGSRAGHGAPEAWTYTYVSDEFEYGTDAADIAVVSPKDAWAFRQGAGSAQALLHYDGSTWQPYALPRDVTEAADGRMERVSLTSHPSGDVWLIASVSHGPGSTNTSFVARFDGTTWHAVPLPDREHGIGGVLVLGPADVWASGSGRTAWHWTGRGWTRSALPFEAQRLVTDPHGTVVWAIGSEPKPGTETPSNPDAPTSQQPASARWDGTRWQRVTIPTDLTLTDGYDFSSLITGTTAVSADEVWATGNSGTEPEPSEDGDYYPADQRPFTLLFDGSRWRVPQDGEHPPAAVLSAKKMRDGVGRTHKIGHPPYVPGVTGEVTAVDRKQKLWLNEITPVPGTDEVWAAGQIELGAHADANFSRAVVVRYRMPG